MDIVEKLSTVKNMLDIMKNFDEDLEVCVQDHSDACYISVRSRKAPVRDYSYTVKHFIAFLLKYDPHKHVGVDYDDSGAFIGISVS